MLTQQRLQDVLNYDPLTGLFKWKVALNNNVKINMIAGSNHSHGYLQTSIDGKKYYLHSLAWFYMTGVWPKEIDHINCIKNDNRWINLREATRTENTQNVLVKKESLTQSKNVYYEARRNKYRVSVRANGKRNFIGYYLTLNEAEKAAEKFMINNHKEFTNIN